MPRVGETILALNAGSSSLKFGLYDVAAEGASPTLRARGGIRALDALFSSFRADGPGGERLADERWSGSPAECTERLLDWVERHSGSSLSTVGHRIVHGGSEFSAPVEIDGASLAKLEALIPLAPLHQPLGLAPVRLIRRSRPELGQIACFDTAFHRTICPPAARYALPRALEDEGIRRYGFHGLSYESIAMQLASEGDGGADPITSRVIVAHLGSGASLCAMRGLKSVDTTMGFSALDGLVMGTRPGSTDPGILLYLLKERGLSVERLEQLLYRQSGLLGVSGISPDVETLLESKAPRAFEALDLFAFQVARHTAALASTLGGLDRFIFTGGIGEHAPAVRRMIVERLAWLGAELDEEANASGAGTISNAASSILIERRATNEELVIAIHAAAHPGSSPDGGHRL